MAALTLAACTRDATVLPDPPDAGGPAAGSCAIASGSRGTIVIRDDLVPSPRCLVVTSSQRVRVINRSGMTLHPRLGTHLNETIAAGRTVTFPGPVGKYLEPGVHHLVFTPASAADIWVDAECRGEGGSDCATPAQ